MGEVKVYNNCSKRDRDIVDEAILLANRCPKNGLTISLVDDISAADTIITRVPVQQAIRNDAVVGIFGTPADMPSNYFELDRDNPVQEIENLIQFWIYLKVNRVINAEEAKVALN
jgi:hypothetical protein